MSTRFALPLVSVLVLGISVATGGCAPPSTLPTVAVDHNQAGAELLAEGHLDEAEARFHLALEYRAGFAEPRANLGLVAFRRGDLPAAERHLEAALRLDEDLASAWTSLGVVREAAGRPDDAQDAYEGALAIDPGLVPARRSLGALLVRRRAYGEARAHLFRLVQVAPDDPIAHAMLAYVELALGRPRAAEARAAAQLERFPDDVLLRAVRGFARAGRGDAVGALEDLEPAAEHPLLGFPVRLRIAAVYVARADLESARPLVRGLLAVEPLDPAVRLVAGWLELLDGQSRAARRHAEAIVRQRPGLYEARLLLAHACEAQRDEACVDAELRHLARAPAPVRRRAEWFRRD